MRERKPPFSRVGGIERSVFASLKDTVQSMRPFPHSIRPEDEDRSLYAQTLDPLVPYDPSIRVEDDGHLLVSYIRGSTTRVKDQNPHDYVERWVPYVDIDTAYRGVQFHVTNSYAATGNEHQRRLAAVRLSNELLMRFQRAGMTDQELLSLHEDALQELFSIKYMTSLDPIRRKTADQLLRATQKDKRGKINTPRSRLMISQERDDIVEDIMVDEIIYNKNKVRGVEIDLERDYERIALGQFATRAEHVADARIGTGAFRQSIQDFRREMHAVISPRYTVRARPYKKVAAEIYYLLYASGLPVEQQRLAIYLGEEKARAIIAGFVPFGQLAEQDQKELVRTFADQVAIVLRQSDRRISMSETDWLFDHDKED